MQQIMLSPETMLATTQNKCVSLHVLECSNIAKKTQTVKYLPMNTRKREISYGTSKYFVRIKFHISQEV